jgi:hypothetical protein
MKNSKLLVALLISIVFGTTVSVLVHQNRSLAHRLHQRDTQRDEELTRTKTELVQTKKLLALAQQKLGYLDKHKTDVQLTAFTAMPGSTQFASGRSIHHAYAVQKPALPGDAIVNVALSPSARLRLNAKFNDLLVITDKRSHQRTVARFVDTTVSTESRSVIDVFFADQRTAQRWGRRHDYVAVNISAADSPFKGY